MTLFAGSDQGEYVLSYLSLDSAGEHLRQARMGLLGFFEAMSRVPKDFEPSRYDDSRMKLSMGSFDAAAEQFIREISACLDQLPGEGETSTEPSGQPLTESSSLPNSKPQGIASFEPELLPGES